MHIAASYAHIASSIWWQWYNAGRHLECEPKHTHTHTSHTYHNVSIRQTNVNLYYKLLFGLLKFRGYKRNAQAHGSGLAALFVCTIDCVLCDFDSCSYHQRHASGIDTANWYVFECVCVCVCLLFVFVDWINIMLSAGDWKLTLERHTMLP